MALSVLLPSFLTGYAEISIVRLFRFLGRSFGLPIVAFVLVNLTFVAQADDSIMADGQAYIDKISAQLVQIDTDRLKDFLKQHPDSEFIDVRLPHEIAAQGGLINAGRRTHALPRGWLEFQIGETVPDMTTPLIVYCSTNRRSPLAAHTLMQMGYTNVRNYPEGFLGWQAEGLPVDATDLAVGSQLFRLPVEVIPNVYSAIGATAPATYENSGHNNNLSFVVTDEGVLVVNAGDNYLLAKALHDEIKEITDQPVKYVVLENGQGHAMLGMNYWQEQGAQVIAHEDAAHEIESRGQGIFERMVARNRDKSMGTKVSSPDTTFAETLELTLGDMTIELLNLGPAHSPGDIVVWLPDQQIVISGDMAFHERLLPVFEDTDTGGWIETWDAFAALGAKHIIPGHGHPTTIDVVQEWTIGYLSYMREEIAKILDDGGSLIDAYKIDQSAYEHLDTFDELAGLNADRIYRAMEFDF